jgi:hypothetical protein
MAALTSKGSHSMGDRRIFLTISVPHSLMATYRINLISAGSTSLDGTFHDYYFYLNDLLFHLSSLFESYQVEILCFEHLYWGEILYFHLGYLYINIIIIFGMRRSSVVHGGEA